jgi:hypothetical protein
MPSSLRKAPGVCLRRGVFAFVDLVNNISESRHQSHDNREEYPLAAHRQGWLSERVNKSETSWLKVSGVFSLLDAGGLIQTAFGKEGWRGGRRTNLSGWA